MILIFVIEVLLTFLSGILALNADDAMMLKFHQSAYILRNQRADVISTNKEYMNIYEIKTFKFNRTVTAFNFTQSAKYDMEDEINIILQAYKRASNEYRLFPMRLRINYCKYFRSNIFGLRNAFKCGNFTKCAFKKDAVYHICNFVLDAAKMPPLVPAGEYKVVITGLYHETEILTIAGYAEVYYPIKMP